VTVRAPSYSENEVLASLCRESFVDFVKEFWGEVPGAGRLVWNWHLDVFCEELQAVAERVFKGLPKEYDLLVNVSPGTSKSTVFSILVPAWVWTRMPAARFITASHTDTLVMDLANKSRHVIAGEKYQACFPEVQFSEEQNRKSFFTNTKGGDRLTCTVGGKSPMGFHAHFLIIDDPIDPKRAVSVAELKGANDFYDAVLPGRKVDKTVSVEITVAQRLHSDDPSGHVLKRAEKESTSAIRHICLPAELAENVNPPELRERYIDGVMDPVRLGLEVLRREKATMGLYAFSGQFSQSPVTLGGGMFKDFYFNNRVKAAPYNARRIRFWDRASTDQGGCYTAGVLLAKDSIGNFYVEDVVHGQWEPDERNQRMRACAQRDRTRYGPKYEPTIYVEAEGGSSGRDAWKGVVRALAGFVVKEDRPTGKKEVRAEPWSCQLAAGNVKIVEDGSWDVQSYIDEHVVFPLGRLKDQVDASSGSFNLLAGARAAGTLIIVPLRAKKYDKMQGPILRILAGSKRQLASLEIEEHRPALVVSVSDPVQDGGNEVLSPFPDSVGSLTVEGSLELNFVDLDPADFQEVWDRPVPYYNKPPGELTLTREQVKRLWGFLTRKYSVNPGVIIFQDEGDRRALSLAKGLCDCLKLPGVGVSHVGSPEVNWRDKPAPNKFVYDLMKAGKDLVVT
jgi:predicted phage terminase large subunit-like protein